MSRTHTTPQPTVTAGERRKIRYLGAQAAAAPQVRKLVLARAFSLFLLLNHFITKKI
jgi:hypothetical protein